MTIVGIVGDIQRYGFDRPSNMEAYVPQAQNMDYDFSVAARTTEIRASRSRLSVKRSLAQTTRSRYSMYAPSRTTSASRWPRTASRWRFWDSSDALAIVLAAVGITG